jgi:hypothetical protein
MALADPQSLTIGSPVAVARVVSNPRSSTFVSADQTVSLLVEQTEPRGTRRTRVAASRSIISTSPLTDLKSSEKATATLTIVRPANGAFTEAQLIELVNSIPTLLQASTNAILKKVLAGES